MSLKKYQQSLLKYIRKIKISDKTLIGIIASVLIVILLSCLLSTVNKFAARNNKIIVTGSAQKDITSDLIVWTGVFSTKSFDLKEAYNKLKNDLVKIRAFLKSKDIKENEMIINAIVINKDFKKIKKNDEEIDLFDGYLLSQSIMIESKNVEKIEKISREITELIQQGVEFYSQQPQYYYSKISELKKIMVGLATGDAYKRAVQIAENSDCKLGKLKNAKMGIFQIIGKNSSDSFSSGGTFNTSSKDKTISINVSLEYNIK